MSKRIVAIVLTIMMVAALIPMTVFSSSAESVTYYSNKFGSVTIKDGEMRCDIDSDAVKETLNSITKDNYKQVLSDAIDEMLDVIVPLTAKLAPISVDGLTIVDTNQKGLPVINTTNLKMLLINHKADLRKFCDSKDNVFTYVFDANGTPITFVGDLSRHDEKLATIKEYLAKVLDAVEVSISEDGTVNVDVKFEQFVKFVRKVVPKFASVDPTVIKSTLDGYTVSDLIDLVLEQELSTSSKYYDLFEKAKKALDIANGYLADLALTHEKVENYLYYTKIGDLYVDDGVYHVADSATIDLAELLNDHTYYYTMTFMGRPITIPIKVTDMFTETKFTVKADVNVDLYKYVNATVLDDGVETTVRGINETYIAGDTVLFPKKCGTKTVSYWFDGKNYYAPLTKYTIEEDTTFVPYYSSYAIRLFGRVNIYDPWANLEITAEAYDIASGEAVSATDGSIIIGEKPVGTYVWDGTVVTDDAPLYAYQLNTPYDVTATCTVGDETITMPEAKSVNVYQILKGLQDDELFSAEERAMYKSLVKLYDATIAYQEGKHDPSLDLDYDYKETNFDPIDGGKDFDTITASENSALNCDLYAQARVIEPWGFEFSAFVYDADNKQADVTNNAEYYITYTRSDKEVVMRHKYSLADKTACTETIGDYTVYKTVSYGFFRSTLDIDCDITFLYDGAKVEGSSKSFNVKTFIQNAAQNATDPTEADLYNAMLALDAAYIAYVDTL